MLSVGVCASILSTGKLKQELKASLGYILRPETLGCGSESVSIWGDGSIVNRTHCSCRGPRLDSKYSLEAVALAPNLMSLAS